MSEDVPAGSLYVEQRCAWCGETKPCVYIPDPFLFEVYDEEVWGWWCEDCLCERAGDI